MNCLSLHRACWLSWAAAGGVLGLSLAATTAVGQQVAPTSPSPAPPTAAPSGQPGRTLIQQAEQNQPTRQKPQAFAGQTPSRPTQQWGSQRGAAAIAGQPGATGRPTWGSQYRYPASQYPSGPLVTPPLQPAIRTARAPAAGFVPRGVYTTHPPVVATPVPVAPGVRPPYAAGVGPGDFNSAAVAGAGFGPGTTAGGTAGVGTGEGGAGGLSARVGTGTGANGFGGTGALGGTGSTAGAIGLGAGSVAAGAGSRVLPTATGGAATPSPGEVGGAIDGVGGTVNYPVAPAPPSVPPSIAPIGPAPRVVPPSPR